MSEHHDADAEKQPHKSTEEAAYAQIDRQEVAATLIWRRFGGANGFDL
jgi:hypothetical protein